jgi:hypothetical protein
VGGTLVEALLKGTGRIRLAGLGADRSAVFLRLTKKRTGGGDQFPPLVLESHAQVMGITSVFRMAGLRV